MTISYCECSIFEKWWVRSKSYYLWWETGWFLARKWNFLQCELVDSKSAMGWQLIDSYEHRGLTAHVDSYESSVRSWGSKDSWVPAVCTVCTLKKLQVPWRRANRLQNEIESPALKQTKESKIHLRSAESKRLPKGADRSFKSASSWCDHVIWQVSWENLHWDFRKCTCSQWIGGSCFFRWERIERQRQSDW